jgi:uncharacterized protein YjeT (DUF2065 family)
MDIYGILLGLFLVIGGLVFLFRPQSLFCTDPLKDIPKIKKYIKNLTPRKILRIRIFYSLIVIIGLILIYDSIWR